MNTCRAQGVIRREAWGLALAAVVAAAQLGSGAQAQMPRSMDAPAAFANPRAPATPTPAPEIGVTPSTLSLGCAGAFTIAVASAGPPGSTLEISALTLANGYSQGYYGTGFTWDLSGITLPASLPSGAMLDIPVSFSAASQPYPSRLELTIDSNAAADPHLFLVYFGGAQDACAATPTPTPTPCPDCVLLGQLSVSAPSVAPPHPGVGDQVTFTFPVTAALPGGFDCESCIFEGGEGYLTGEDPPMQVGDTVVVHRRVVRAGSTTVQLHVRETTEEQCYSPDPVEGCRTFFQFAFIEAASGPFNLQLGEEASCAGDCDADGEATVSEVVTLVTIALDEAMISTCPVGDRDGNGRITIDELIVAVRTVLDGCPAAPAFAIRGTVTEFPGCMGYMRGITVVLDPLGLTTQTAIGPDPAVAGTFAFADVPPGDYTLTVSPQCNPYGCWQPTPVQVVDQDVDVLICNVAS